MTQGEDITYVGKVSNRAHEGGVQDTLVEQSIQQMKQLIADVANNEGGEYVRNQLSRAVSDLEARTNDPANFTQRVLDKASDVIREAREVLKKANEPGSN